MENSNLAVTQRTTATHHGRCLSCVKPIIKGDQIVIEERGSITVAYHKECYSGTKRPFKLP